MPGIGLNGALFMGSKSLNTQSIAMQAVGNNIANANTPGYARERANIVPSITVNTGIGEQGTGSEVSTIESLRSNLLDGLVQQSFGASGYYSNQSTLYSSVQTSLGEQFTTNGSGTAQNTSTTGVQSAMTHFFGSFQNLASTPSDSTARQLVVQNSQALAQTLQGAYGRVQSAENNVASDATSVTGQINTLSQQIGSLNQQIKQVENDTGFTANELRDNRVSAIQQLSQLANVTATTQSDGTVNIALQDNPSVALVKGSYGGGNGGGTQSLSVTYNANAAVPITVSASTTGALGTGVPSGGSLGAHLDTINNLIGATGAQGGTGLLGQMDGEANALIRQVNTQQEAGQDLQGNAGTAFFTGTGAANIAVSSNIAADPSLIAASSGTGVLDGSNAQAIANLQTASAILPAYQTTVSNLGASVETSQNASTTQAQVTANLQKQQNSVEGVSIDEEMTNLIQYQNAYEASARFINVVSQMFNTLITGTGNA